MAVVIENAAGDGSGAADDPTVGSGMADQTPLPVRTRTISWQDPHALADAGRTLAGLDFITRMASGELPGPPIAELFGMTIESVQIGDVVFRCEPDESTYNTMGIVHGGLACGLLDTVAGCAVHTTLAAGVGYTSLEIKVNYLRPIRGGTVLTAHGWVTKTGRRAAFAEGDIRDPDGTLLATASSCCLILGG